MKTKYEKAVIGNPKLLYRDGVMIDFDESIEDLNAMAMVLDLMSLGLANAPFGCLWVNSRVELKITLDDVFKQGVDVEIIPFESIPEVYQVYRSLGLSGVINYVAGRRVLRAE